MPDEIIPVEATPVEPKALEQMERASIDVQIATAHQYPRSMSRFIQQAREMVSIDTETAESCIYRRPVGKDNRGNVVYASGESIRLAEIVAACYGNIRAKAIILETAPTFVKAAGFAHDLEKNYAVSIEVIEPTITKDGRPYDERMRLVVAKAALKKAMRDAIFSVVPKSLCKPVIQEARRIIAGEQKPLEERRKAVGEWMNKLGIDPARVFAALGINGLEELTEEKLEILTGVRTALKEGDITLDEAFPPIEHTAEDSSEKTQGVAALLEKLKTKEQSQPLSAEPGADDTKILHSANTLPPKSDTSAPATLFQGKKKNG